tara:strand:- start:703 stop:1212 length:510 start_codon:yes stop_codon:yes gene_type:complete
MKQILTEWRKYITEEDNLEQNLYSFDFDNTLIRYHTLEDGDVEYLGPHEENIQKVRDLAAAGHTVIIVTSRFGPLVGPKKPWDDAPTPEELIADLGLPIEVVEYTSGEAKVKKLLELGVSKHWDDDREELKALEGSGIDGEYVPVPGEETELLRNKWKDHLAKSEEETI